MNRVTALEALRFLSIVQICIWHFSYPIITTGYLGVEFFFILAGMFIYKNAVKSDSPGIIRYTIQKISKFYVKYLFAVVFAFIVFYKDSIANFTISPLHSVMVFLSEALMLQGTGVFTGGENTPLWFFSVLIWSGGLVYGLIKYYTNISIRVIFPIIVLLYGTYTFQRGGNVNMENWNVDSAIYIPMLRGFSELSFGVLAGYVYFNYFEKINISSKLFNCISIIALICYLWIVIWSPVDTPYAFIFIPLLICASLTSTTWLSKVFQGKIWIKLGRLSYDLFLIHYPLAVVVKHFLFVQQDWSIESVAVVYYALLLPVGYVYDKICSKIPTIVK